MDLTKLEQDLLGDMNEDTYGCWEVFQFAKLHNPSASEDAVLRIGLKTLRSWASRGWLSIAAKPLLPTSVQTIDEALRFIEGQGLEAICCQENAPSFDLAPQARRDVAWLRGV